MQIIIRGDVNCEMRSAKWQLSSASASVSLLPDYPLVKLTDREREAFLKQKQQ